MDGKFIVIKLKYIIAFLIILLVFGALVLMNPTKEDFNKYLYKSSTENYSEDDYESAASLGLTKLLEFGYKRQNFYLFSIYKNNNSYSELLGAKNKEDDFIYIGILKFFIKIN